jgi:hypothetical protein
MPAYHSGKPARAVRADARGARTRKRTRCRAALPTRRVFACPRRRIVRHIYASSIFSQILPQIEYFTILPPHFLSLRHTLAARGGAASVCRRMIRRHAGFSFFATFLRLIIYYASLIFIFILFSPPALYAIFAMIFITLFITLSFRFR